MKRWSLVVGCVVLSAACGSAMPRDFVPEVKKKAAFELGCAEEQLQVTELADKSTKNMAGSVESKDYGVNGCGKRASYNAFCVNAMMSKEQCGVNQTSAPLTDSAGSTSPSSSAEPAGSAAPRDTE